MSFDDIIFPQNEAILINEQIRHFTELAGELGGYRSIYHVTRGPASGRGAEYCDERVCLFVCRSVYLSSLHDSPTSMSL